ncbi:MAG: hypothetical protein LIP10_02815 [Clostridiales bacterium]|nr:hypothetical protein [Clostridiales bacterium]MCC8177248.1 hypothetical protein [Bacteroidales bacterium]
MAWIQVHQQLKDHRKLLMAADELEIDPPYMLGLLVSFWLWALDNTPSGSLDGVNSRTIARAAQWNGNPDDFVNALCHAGLIDGEPGETMALHDWYEYTGKLIDQREAEKNRSRRRRAAAQAEPADTSRTTDKRPPDDRRTTAGQTEGRPQTDRETTGGRLDQTRLEKSRQDKTREEGESSTPDGVPAAEPVPFEEIVTLYHTTCTSYPRLRNISDGRKKAIRARWKEYSQNIDTFRELFEKAEASAFMKGRNSRNWTADFNWLMKADNMAKVLEGKYDDTQAPRTAPAAGGSGKVNTLGVLADIIAREEGGGQL